MNLILRLFFISIMMFCSGCVSSLYTVWTGTYQYTVSYAESAGGSPVIMDYTVIVSKEDDGLTAVITESGYQTFQTILCDVREEKNRIVLLFKSYENGEVSNMYGVRVYSPGQSLLALEREDGKDSTECRTYWLGMKGLNDETPEPGVYFRKIKNEI